MKYFSFECPFTYPVISNIQIRNQQKWCLKLNKLTLGCIIGVVTASEFSVAVPWFDPIITICGRPFSIGNLNIRNGICYQGRVQRTAQYVRISESVR